MQTVKVKTSELMTKLHGNRDAHRELFLKAQQGYRKQVIDELDRMLADARGGRQIVRAIRLPEPVDHTADYDRVIAMLAMSVESEVELSAGEFDNFVMDNWAWAAQARHTNSSYL